MKGQRHYRHRKKTAITKQNGLAVFEMDPSSQQKTTKQSKKSQSTAGYETEGS